MAEEKITPTTDAVDDTKKNQELAKMREMLEKFHPHCQASHEDPNGTAIELSLASPKRIAHPHISFLARRPAELVENADTKALVGDFLLNGEQRGYSQSTIRNYREDVRDFLDSIGSLPVVAVRPIHIREWLAQLIDRGFTPNTLARKVYALRALYDFLQLLGAVTVSPARQVRPRKQTRKLPRVLTLEEGRQAHRRVLLSPRPCDD